MLSRTVATQNDQMIFAAHPHIDSYRNQLKILVPLTDIESHNGPTEVLKGSHEFN